MSEAEKPLEAYQTIEDVFGRRLKEGARWARSEFVSPADGMMMSQPIRHKNLAVQAKGLYYEIPELVYGSLESVHRQDWDFSWITTVYLAPHNYHRVHAPVGGKLTAIRHIPGNLWPVSLNFARALPRLFLINERLVFDIDSPYGRVFVVMVGATNVGRMRTPYLEHFVTNKDIVFLPNKIVNQYPLDPAVELQCGDELGTFLLGSTVVLVFEKGFPVDRFQEIPQHLSVRMGDSLLPQ
jgi:phosphatidylserine decarboxylase